MNWNDPVIIASVFNLGGPDLLIIGMIMLLLWGAKKLPNFARQISDSILHRRIFDQASKKTFFDFALILLMIGVLMWAIILAEYL